MASRHELRARHTEEKQKQNPQELFKRNMAVAALVGMTAAAAIGVFAKEYFLDYGDITVEATEDGNFVSYTDENEEYHEREENTDGEIIITQDSEEAVKNTLTIDVEEDQTVEVTIRDVNIDVSGNAIYNDKYQIQNGEDLEAAISIEGAGNVILELDGKNVVKSDEWHAGVETAGTGMLTIQDKDEDGRLDAKGGMGGAGIGGGMDGDGNVTINGGEIAATGGWGGAGIGSGAEGNSNVIINGGKIEAIGNDKVLGGPSGGAGIGNGTLINYIGKSNITINGGEISAAGHGTHSGIGTYPINISGSENNIEINGGKINATSEIGEGIGGGKVKITINGGEIHAEATSGDGIGGHDSTTTINGGTISATGGGSGAGIGGDRSTIVIAGGEVNAVGGSSPAEDEDEVGGAGIGGSNYNRTSDITITGGTINAVGGANSAGIGGGKHGSATITIDGGTVTATAGSRVEYNRMLTEADAIGAGGIMYKRDPETGEWVPYYKKVVTKTVTMTDGTIIEQPDGWDADGHTHTWKVNEYTAPTYEAKGVEISLCECGSKKTEFLSALAPDKQMPLTVTTLSGTAQPYEQSVANGHVIFAAPAQDAILTGSLGALAELKAQEATTLVFRTQQCETSVSIDKILAAGSEDDVFALTHKGTEAVLTVEGRVVE